VSIINSLDLYSQLPAIYRIRDAERGYPLRGLLGLVSAQAQLVKADIDGLWDDLFIETCAGWVIPYIGDLVANNPISQEIAQTRADVARTIYYRRRKGTLTMLEEMARDVTRWDAHAVAFFEELGWSQNLDHLRFDPDAATDPHDPPAVGRVGTVLLRDLDALDRLNGPFDTMTHTVDVRPICQATGWYDIRNIGFFLWRLESFFTQDVTPRKSSTYADGYAFSPIGNPAPLYTNPAPAPQGTQLVVETQVQAPIRPVAFYFNPGNYYFNAPPIPTSFAIYHGTTATSSNLIPLSSIVCGDLADWLPPASGKVVVDVLRGRFAFAPGETPKDGLTVSYTYGFSGNLGSGPYDRRLVQTVAGDPGPAVPDTVANPGSLGVLIRVPSAGIDAITQAIAAWDPAVGPRAVIQIEDNRTYVENLTITLPVTPVPPGQPAPLVVIQAGNLQRPTLIGNITVTGGTGAEQVVLNGLLIAGNLHVPADLGLLEIVHCTLVPGSNLDEQGQPLQLDPPCILVDPPADSLQLLIDHAIVGALRLPEGMTGLTVRDSIIDSPAPLAIETPLPAIAADDGGDAPGPSATLLRTTIFGRVHVQQLVLASEVIFTSVVLAKRRQNGCARFSFVPEGSVTPRRYRCQPDFEITGQTEVAEQNAAANHTTLSNADRDAIRDDVRGWLQPSFTDLHYGLPGYAQLSLSCPPQIRTGAEDGSEMGVFCFLKQPERVTSLRVRLNEYLPFGLEPGLIYVT